MTTEEVYDEFNLGSIYFHQVTGDTADRLWNIRETLVHMNPKYNCGHFYCCGHRANDLWDTEYASWTE